MSDIQKWMKFLDDMHIPYTVDGEYRGANDEEVVPEVACDEQVSPNVNLIYIGIVSGDYQMYYNDEYMKLFGKRLNNPSLSILFDMDGNFKSFEPFGE